jgi:tetratricopeptide (TPR) repeat protein
MSNIKELDEISNITEKLEYDLEALPSSSFLSAAESDVIYALAVDSVNKNDFEKAVRFFSFLTIYNPTNPLYLYSYGYCLRMLEKYDEALHQFSLAASFNPEEPVHTLAIAECLVMKNDYVEAQKTLDLVIRFTNFLIAESPQPLTNSSQQTSSCLLGCPDKVLIKAEALQKLIAAGAGPA